MKGRLKKFGIVLLAFLQLSLLGYASNPRPVSIIVTGSSECGTIHSKAVLSWKAWLTSNPSDVVDGASKGTYKILKDSDASFVGQLEFDLNMFSAWAAGDELNVEVVYSECGVVRTTLWKEAITGTAGTQSDTSDPNRYLIIAASPVAEPELTVENLCPGGDGTIKIANVTDFKSYSLKVQKGGSDASGFTLGALGATTTIQAASSVAPGTYTAVLTDGTASYTKDFTVQTPPTLTIAANLKDGANGYYCTGGANNDALKLTATCSATGYSYAWERDGAAIAGTSNALAAVTQAGVYKVKATKSGACPAEATMTVAEKTAPTKPAITAPASKEVCLTDGGQTVLNVNAPATGHTYKWSTGATGNSLTVAHNAVATTGTTYTVQDNDGFCNSALSDALTLTGHEVKVSITPASKAVAEGAALTLTATATTNPTTGGIDATSWNWTGTGAGIHATSNVNSASIQTNGITASSDYTVTVKDQYGCSATAKTTYTVQAGTSWDFALTDKAECTGTSIALAPTMNGAPATPLKSTTWSSIDGLTFANPNAQNTTVTTTTPGEYSATLTIVDANDVKKEHTMKVKVYGKPTLGSVEVTSTAVCKGDEIALRANNAAAATTVLDQSANLTYVWTNAHSGTTPGNTNTADLASAGENVYQVKVRDGNGCESAPAEVSYVGHEVKVTAKMNGSSAASVAVPFATTAALDCEVTLNPTTGTPTPTIASYQWTGAAGFTGATTGKTATTEVLKNAGSYTITVTDNNGCTGTDEIAYTMEGGELTVTAADVYICFGSDTKVTCTPSGGSGADAVTYQWMAVNAGSGLVFDAENAQSTTVKTTPAGVYQAKVRVTKGTQTVESDEITITVGEQPVLAGLEIQKYDVAGTNIVGTVETGGTVLPGTKVDVVATMTETPAGTKYTWTSTPTGRIDYTSVDELTATSVALTNGSACFKLVVTNADGQCPAQQEVCLNVSGTGLSVAVQDAEVCLGSTTTLTATPTGGVKPYVSYSWQCSDPNFKFTPSADQTKITVDATTPAGTYTGTVTLTDKAGNTTTGSFEVTVKPLPTWVAVTPATPQNVKVGNTLTLSATVTPSTATLTWSGTPAEAQTGTAGTASIVVGPYAVAGGAYPYTVKADLNGCTMDSTITVQVVDKTVDITITGSDEVALCEGEGGMLAVDAIGGSGNLSYRWEVISGDIQLAAHTGKQVAVNAASAGSHRVRVTVSDNSTTDPAPDQYKDIVVNVAANPTINSIVVNNLTQGTTNVTTVNYGDELEIVADVNPLDVTCTWTETGSDLQSPNGNRVYVQAIQATNTFTLTAASKGGCTTQQSVTVIVNRPENAALLELTLDRKCPDTGESMLLTMKAQGGTTYSFTLRNNAGFSKEFTGAGPWTHAITLDDQDTYFVQNFKAFKNGLEVTPTQVVPATIQALFYTSPAITIAKGTVQQVCEGDELTLTATSQLAGTEFVWNNGVVNGVPFFPTTSGTYTVTATTEQGCQATSTVNVTMITKPTVTISASTEELCLGETVTLTAGGNATEFVWNNGQTGNTIQVTPTVGGHVKYVVTGTENINGCAMEAAVTLRVGEPPVIVSTSRVERNIAIGKGVTFGVKATGENLKYQWKRWDGTGWFDLYDDPAGLPGISGATTDSLSLSNVPQSWNDMQFQCVISNHCGTVDTTFLLHVKECFEILDVEWDMCEGIRPETDPSVQVDGWYCPGTRIGVCARLILDEDVEIDLRDAVFKWTVDGLQTDDGRWGEMVFISDSAKLSWVPSELWQDNITIALAAYVDGACDTVYKSYLRLKATPFAELDVQLKTSVASQMFCPGDTIAYWIEDPNKTAGMNPTYRWYNDIFDLQTENSPNNEVISMQKDKVVLAMGQQDTWMKVIITPSSEICTRQPEYVDTAFLKVKQLVEPEFSIYCEDTLACYNDEIRLEARWENAGEHPTFEWTRSIGYPYWSLGTEATATTILDEDDIWVKCVLKPSDEVCFNIDTIFTDAVRLQIIKDPKVVIAADLENKTAGDEIWIESDISGLPIQDPIYTWYINNRIDQQEGDLFVSSELRQNDSIYLGVRGERICQNQIFSNTLVIDFNRGRRDTLVTIYQGEQIRNMNMLQPGDDLTKALFTLESVARFGVGSISPEGVFNYVPNAGFVGTDEVTYQLIDKITKAIIAEGTIYITVRGENRFVIPNLITPNDDGLNDTWKLDFLADYPNHRVMIFDRNGKLVFESSNYQNDWDGTGYSGVGYVAHINLMNGVYTYVIDLGDKDKTILKSWVEIRADINKRNYR